MRHFFPWGLFVIILPSKSIKKAKLLQNMFRFPIGKIPVEVRVSHVAFSLLLAFFLSRNAPITPVAAVLSWVAVISLSVLVHELGHALTSLAFGYRPSVVLVAMGGYTLTPAETPIPWLKEIALTLAGPLAGYLLAGLFALVQYGLPNDSPFTLYYVCSSFFWANLVWSTFNLIPMGPLDGGRVAALFLMRIAPKRGLLYTQVLGLLFGVPLLAWALWHQNPFMALFVGAFVLRSVQIMVELVRHPPALANTPSSSSPSAELLSIEQLLQEGAFTEGLRQAENLLASPLPPEENIRAHYLAGWLSLKTNQGRKALRHFSQTENMEIPPQAMAAAFSLTGEDERALPLWEMAAVLSENPVLLHEWAGTLLRLGRVEVVRAMPKVRLAKAYLCAQSVFRLRGEYAQAAEAAEASFHAEPQADVAYEAACNHTLAGDKISALRMLALAAQNGFNESQKALEDPDLLPLHPHPEFQQW
ncbi:MAG: hypothetical protein FWB81_07325, partial [Cystobacterineae bacterium]|nr:hypothetical protein [Cystobacterineae bacterium]